MKFIHLTDTHYVTDSAIKDFPEVLQQVFKEQISFDQKLELLVNQENLEELDFVVVTGDLVHEGNHEAYLELFTKLENTFQDKPIFYTLGNHDNKESFNLAMFSEKTDQKYNHSKELNGHQLIFLDSGKIGSSLGEFNSEQLAWLNQELASSDLPKLIFFHHPLFGGSDFQKFIVPDAQPIIEILNQHQIMAIFTGHTHQMGVHIKANLTQFSNYCFGFSTNHKDLNIVLEFTNLIGYSIVEISDVISVQPRILTPRPKALSRIERKNIKV